MRSAPSVSIQVWCHHIEDLRVQETSSGTSVLCPLGLKASNVITFSSDTGDDWDAVVYGLDKSLDDIDLFIFGEEGAFTGVSEDD